MDEQRYTDLISQELTGTIGAADAVKLKLWREADAANEQTYQELLKLWSLTEDYDTDHEPDMTSATARFEAAMDRVDEERSSSSAKAVSHETKVIPLSPWRTIMRVAAAVVIGIGCWIGYEAVNNYGTTLVATAADQEVSVELPDGSVVWVNRNSKLRYSTDFEERHVTLDGEAFFEVEPDANHPFVVNTGQAATTVLGTSFNVNEGLAMLEVTVVTGKVRVAHNESNEAVELTPGQKALVDQANGSVIQHTNTDANFRSWQTDTLKFPGVKLEDMATALSNHFDERVELVTPGLGNCTFSGTFGNPELKSVFEVLESSGDYTVTNTGNGWEITGTPCN